MHYTEVIAYFQFKDNQIINIHGQVRMIEGKPSDVDMLPIDT